MKASLMKLFLRRGTAIGIPLVIMTFFLLRDGAFYIISNPVWSSSEIGSWLSKQKFSRPVYQEIPDRELYNFINQYYLPTLTHSKNNVRLFAKALTPPEYFPFDFLPPIPYAYHEGFDWDEKQLSNITIVTDDDKSDMYPYYLISKPVFTAHDSRVYIFQHLIEGFRCGTGNNQVITFLKDNGKWTLKKH